MQAAFDSSDVAFAVVAAISSAARVYGPAVFAAASAEPEMETAECAAAGRQIAVALQTHSFALAMDGVEAAQPVLRGMYAGYWSVKATGSEIESFVLARF